MSRLGKELGFLARRDVSLILDKLSPTGNDWRGLVDKMGFSYQVNMALSKQESPTLALLEEWERALGQRATLDALITIVDSLGCQEAVDVLRREKARKQERLNPSVHSGSVSDTDSGPVSPRDRGMSTDSTNSVSSLEANHHPLTPCNSIEPSMIDPATVARIHAIPLDLTQLSDRIRQLDVVEEEGQQSKASNHTSPHSSPSRRTKGSRAELEESLAYIQSQRYDVFLSFAKADVEFAEEVRQKLKLRAKLEVFVPSEDLMPGRAFSEQVADMIKRGCRKTVVIMSPDYVKSEWCSYEARLAHHQSPECRTHCLIPILYRKCKVPDFMAYIYYLDYPRYQDNQHQLDEFFWKRLYKSLNYEGHRHDNRVQ